jgi:hypothetical protein
MDSIVISLATIFIENDGPDEVSRLGMLCN